MQVLYILVAILLFGVLIAVHEFGHFAVAKLCGVRVNEFSIGMGPCIWQGEKGETVYSLRAFPAGGYCAMEGEDTATDDPRSFVNQGFFKKFAVLVAGSAMNFLMGIVLVFGLYSSATGFYTPEITGFAPEFDTANSPLAVGDTLYRIDGERVYLYNDIGLLLSLGDGDGFDIQVLRDGKKVTLKDVPLAIKSCTSADGAPYQGYGFYFGDVAPATLGNKLSYSWNTTLGFVRSVRLSLQMMVSGEAGIKDMSGPVGIVDTISQMGTQAPTFLAALENIFYFGALLAVNLAVMNLLPIPALDGGRILFLLVDVVTLAIFKKKLPEKYMAVVNTVFLMLLLGVMLLITFKDVFVIFEKFFH